jgi:hypothetical protein
MRTKMIRNAPHHYKCLEGDGNIIDGEYSPLLKCSRRWKYSGWGVFSIIPTILVPKSCSTDGECSPLPLPMSTKKFAL